MNNNKELEALTESFRNNLGTAYSKSDDSYIGVLSYTICRMLQNYINTCRSIRLQQTPLSMDDEVVDNVFNMLGFASDNKDTKSKREMLHRIFSRKTKYQTNGNVSEYISNMLDDIFLNLSPISKSDTDGNPDGYTVGSIPGGLVTDVVNIKDGNWTSPLSFLPVRLWNPRNTFGEEQYSTQEFLTKANSFKPELDRYLPVGVSTNWYTHVGDNHDGNISYAPGDNFISGSSTTFLSGISPISNNEELEVLSDNNILYTFIVENVLSDTIIQISNPTNLTLTNQSYRRRGVFLGVDGVLGFAGF